MACSGWASQRDGEEGQFRQPHRGQVSISLRPSVNSGCRNQWIPKNHADSTFLLHWNRRRGFQGTQLPSPNNFLLNSNTKNSFKSCAVNTYFPTREGRVEEGGPRMLPSGKHWASALPVTHEKLLQRAWSRQRKCLRSTGNHPGAQPSAWCGPLRLSVTNTLQFLLTYTTLAEV